MQYIAGAIAVIIIVAALGFLLEFIKSHSLRRSKTRPQKDNATLAPDGRTAIVACPLCGSHLPKGEEIVSKVWRAMNVPEQRIVIFGCPHCYPKCEAGLYRECPHCHKAVPEDGHLVAHLFNLPTGKKHVSVAGCTGCCKFEKKMNN